MVGTREDVEQVEEEREDDVKDQEGHQRAPLLVRGIDSGQRTTALGRPAVLAGRGRNASSGTLRHKTGTGARNFHDAGIVFRGDEPRFILTVYTEHVPAALPDGLPGHAAAGQLIARLGRACWDALPA